jgi:hypothetical protein
MAAAAAGTLSWGWRWRWGAGSSSLGGGSTFFITCRKWRPVESWLEALRLLAHSLDPAVVR